MSDQRRADIRRRSRDILAENSGSFDWAALFLSRPIRDDAAVVYAFCRTVDDIADQSDSPDRARSGLERIEAELAGEASPRPLVAEFRRVCSRRDIELDCARELIRGVRSDLGTVTLETDRELLRYCYRVAGTVGLMMSPLLGVDHPTARRHAIDLGVAMQLTNICRDVREDAARDRVYIPRARLEAAGTSPRELLAGRIDGATVADVVVDLLDLADRYYRSGRDGMRYIPFRPRIAIEAASRLYRGIGDRLRRRGGNPLSGPAARVGTFGKVRRMLGGLFGALNPFVHARSSEHPAELHAALDGLPGTAPSAPALDSP